MLKTDPSGNWSVVQTPADLQEHINEVEEWFKETYMPWARLIIKNVPSYPAMVKRNCVFPEIITLSQVNEFKRVMEEVK